MLDFESHPWKAVWLASIMVATFAFAAIGFYTVEGSSMYPAISPGDRLLIYRWARIRKGDVVILSLPNSDQLAVKRVMGVPGDKVAFFGNFIRVADHQLPLKQKPHPELANADEVPVDSMFVAGDRIESSVDSRDYGFVPREAIIGRVLDFGRK